MLRIEHDLRFCLTIPVLGDRLQQRIDGRFLDLVWRRPSEPLIGRVFGQHGSDRVFDFAQEKNQVLLKDLARVSFAVFDGIGQTELKGWIEMDIGRHDAGFFFCFPQSGLGVRFITVAMSFREVPAFLVTHQQELTWLGTRDQQDSGSEFLGQRFRLAGRMN